jgi:hypothetical protein
MPKRQESVPLETYFNMVANPSLLPPKPSATAKRAHPRDQKPRVPFPPKPETKTYQLDQPAYSSKTHQRDQPVAYPKLEPKPRTYQRAQPLHFSEPEPKSKLYQRDQLIKFTEPEPKNEKKKKVTRLKWLQNRPQADAQNTYGKNLLVFLYHHFVQTTMQATILDFFFFGLFWAAIVYFITTDAVIGFAMAVTGASFCAFGSWGIYSVVKALVTWPFGGRKGDVDEDLPPHQLEYY